MQAAVSASGQIPKICKVFFTKPAFLRRGLTFLSFNCVKSWDAGRAAWLGARWRSCGFGSLCLGFLTSLGNRGQILINFQLHAASANCSSSTARNVRRVTGADSGSMCKTPYLYGLSDDFRQQAGANMQSGALGNILQQCQHLCWRACANAPSTQQQTQRAVGG